MRGFVREHTVFRTEHLAATRVRFAPNPYVLVLEVTATTTPMGVADLPSILSTLAAEIVGGASNDPATITSSSSSGDDDDSATSASGRRTRRLHAAI